MRRPFLFLGLGCRAGVPAVAGWILCRLPVAGLLVSVLIFVARADIFFLIGILPSLDSAHSLTLATAVVALSRVATGSTGLERCTVSWNGALSPVILRTVASATDPLTPYMLKLWALVAVTRVVSACVAHILDAPRWGGGRCIARPHQRWCMACDNRYAAGTHRCGLRRERRLRSLRSGRSDRSGLHGWGGTACDVQGVTRSGSGASLPMQ